MQNSFRNSKLTIGLVFRSPNINEEEEDRAGNIISQGFLMAKDLNFYFSSMFTRFRELFLLNEKKQTSYHYLKRVREISQIITDQ